MELLRNIAFLLIELKAFSASTESTASVLSCWNKPYIAWMAASLRPHKPVKILLLVRRLSLQHPL